MSELVNTTTTLGTAIQGGVSSVAGGITGKLGFMSKFAFKNPLYLLAAIPLIVFFWWYLKKGGKMNQKRVLFFAVRAVVISLICLALAEPVWVETSRTIEDMPPITVMVDASGSMILFNETEPLGHEVYGRVKSLAGNITSKSDKISLEYFSEGNRTAIGDALYYSMLKSEDEGGIIVLLTDGNNNYGRNPLDVARALSEANSTVYAIRPGKAGRDVYIKDVIGDKKIPSNSEYQLIITIGNTGFLEVTYDINVYVDNVKQFGKRFTQNEMEKSIELQLNFQETGVHEIRVELSTVGEDSINSNNVYYKTVEVVEKPRILVVTNSSTNPLMSVLKRLYSVDEVRNPPEDYSRYTAVVLDDIPASQLDRNTVNKLKQYVLRGNGLAVVGGKHSYEYGGYNSSFIENILPVMSTDKPKERRKEIAVAFVIDRSGSQQERVVGAKDSSIDIAKAITLKLMRKLAENDSVGVMAFDTLPHEVSPMSPIGPKRADLEDRVLRLQAAAKDGTEPTTSLELARNWLKQYTGDKYVIFLSDGQYSRSTLPKIIAQAEAMKQENIKVYVVGVGSVVMDFFLEPIATSSGGLYFNPEAQERLNLEFGENRKEDEGEIFRLNVRDQSHFITRGMNLDATTIRGYNRVYEKSASQLLITTRGGQPILTVWNFGLGRVASLTTDNGNSWATGDSGLYGTFKGKVVSGMINWVIGDLEKGKKVNIRAEDISLGDSEEISVKASAAPSLTVKEVVKDAPYSISLIRTGPEQYTGTFTPANTGFYGLRATASGDQDLDAIAVNYPKEYSELGLNEGVLESITGATGGMVYDSSELKDFEEDLLDHVKKVSTQEIINETQLWQYFAALALAFYFIDVIARRLWEMLSRKDVD